jgi:hypothetical protein
MMSEFDWRSSRAYDLKQAEHASFAWEYMRRDTKYHQAYRSLSNLQLSTPSDFRTQWGLVFRG